MDEDKKILELINNDSDNWTIENTGLMHTHWRCHVNTTGGLGYESICKNQEGSAYGQGITGYLILPEDIKPDWPYDWTDIAI